MKQKQELQQDIANWQRRILNGYWLLVLLSFIAEATALIVLTDKVPNGIQSFLIHTLLIPTSIQLSLVLANEVLERKYNKQRPYTIIFTGIILFAVLIYGNKLVIGIQYVMLVPMLVATFHFTKRYLTFAYWSANAVLICMYLIFPEIWYHMTIFERVALFLIMLGEYFVLVQLVKRGNDLLKQLMQISSSEQDLLVKKTIMEQLSKTDALTELNNHRTFQEYLDHMIEHSDKNKMLLQMAIIDIDNFKSVNDTYGHSVGDVILKRVAKVIEDSITSDDILARYGGEEFSILFPAKTLQQALDICENIRQSISHLDNPEMGSRKITVSIGLSSYVFGTGKSNFFNSTDIRLYEAKETGKNKTVYKNK